MRITLGVSGLWSRFDGRIFSADMVARPKPFPDLFLHAAKTMGFAPQECAVIEDSHFGVKAAVRGGFRVFGYAKEHTAHILEKEGAQVIYEIEELYQHF